MTPATSRKRGPQTICRHLRRGAGLAAWSMVALTGTVAWGDGEVLVQRLTKLRPDIPIERVSPTPLPNVLALELTGGTVLYGTADGRYLFAGDMYELKDTSLVNLAESGRADKRRELLAGVERDDMVVFSPRGDVKAAITVFTDVDCGFCRKLHLEVPTLNQSGVEVRYLAYPRAGVGSKSYDRIVTAWCSDDRNDALTRLKAGEDMPQKTCVNPVAAQYELGRQIGVTGTPAILLDDGTMLPGYMPAEELIAHLGL